MERYETREIRAARPAEEVWAFLADMRNVNPLIGDRAAEWKWEAAEDTCSLVVAGFPLRLRRTEAVPHSLLRWASEGPIAFTLEETVVPDGPGRSVVKLTFDIQLNPLMRMMLEGRIRAGLDRAADYLEDLWK